MPNRAARRAAERAENIRATQAFLANHPEPIAPVQEPTEPTFAAAANAESKPERKPISEAQLKANRENAQKSTGPSEAGKEASSQNRLSHGLARHNGRFTLIHNESMTGFLLLKNSLFEEHQPTSETEGILVNAMAESHWLANRAQNLANSCFEGDGDVEDQKLFALYLRYQTMHTRAFYKSLNQLLSLRAEKQKAAHGFEAQKLKQAAETRAVETLAFKKEVFLWQKEVAQSKKTQPKTAPPPQTSAESSPQTQKWPLKHV